MSRAFLHLSAILSTFSLSLTTEMRMLRWIQGVILREHNINEEIGEAATVQLIATIIPDSEATTLVWTCQT